MRRTRFDRTGSSASKCPAAHHPPWEPSVDLGGPYWYGTPRIWGTWLSISPGGAFGDFASGEGWPGIPRDRWRDGGGREMLLKRGLRWASVVGAVALFLLSGVASGTDGSGLPQGPISRSGDFAVSAALADAVRSTSLSLSHLEEAVVVPVSDAVSDSIAPGSIRVPGNASFPLSIVVTFRLSNETGLIGFLTALVDESSPLYHHYLTAAQFDARYSPSLETYDAAAQYFASFGVSNLTILPDRVSISFDASVSVADALFHTEIDEYDVAGETYYAPSETPELPSPLASAIAQVSGLGTYSTYVIATSLGRGVLVAPPSTTQMSQSASTVAGYLSPPTVDGTQFEYGSDFQVAYDEQGLFTLHGYPTSASIATILWAGTYTGSTGTTPCGFLTNGQDVGPWVPADIYDFYNETMPSGEPHAHLVAVPLGGASPPGPEASCDSTNAQLENTLDLEMVGSTAPGAEIYNVYGPQATFADTDEAFTNILSPPSTLSASVQAGLANVSVISNSWGSTDHNDTSWYESLQQAQARGISVLACSGDSDDSLNSPMYWGSTVYFPASMSYDTFGDTAVGGTTVNLNPSTLQVESQVVWNISADGGPVGSTGGISTIFPEPTWQVSTEANRLITGAGRGDPDLAAIANNMLITITVNGVQYQATAASFGGEFYYCWGTSIASPLTAGMIAEMDYDLRGGDSPLLGFLNPWAYSIASAAYLTGHPSGPFSDVTSGSNYLYHAAPGYDLVTGWGSLNALNYATDVQQSSYGVKVTETGLPSGSTWYVNITGEPSLRGTGNTISTALPNGTYSYTAASANREYSAPPGSFTVKGSGISVSVTFSMTYAVTFTETGLPLGTKWFVNVTASSLSYNSVTNTISFNELNGTYAYRLGSANTNWAASGGSFTVNAAVVSVTPVFTLWTYEVTFTESGLPSGMEWFVNVTGGTSHSSTTATVSFAEPNGSYAYAIGTQNTRWTASGGLFTVKGSGIPESVTFSLVTYKVTFTKSGLPPGTKWFVNVTAGPSFSSTTSTVSFFEPNGTYTYTLGSANTSWAASGGLFTVKGSGISESATFNMTYTVTFTESGMPIVAGGGVNFSGGGMTSFGAGGVLSYTEPNGSYTYTISAGSGYTLVSDSGSGRVTVAGSNVGLTIIFEAIYEVTFTEDGLPSGTEWFVNVTGGTSHSSTTATVSFAEPNGTWDYTLGSADTRYEAAGGLFTVAAGTVSESMTFSLVTYTVTFTESGLPTKMLTKGWTVEFDDAVRGLTSTSTTFVVPNGTYAALITGPSGYRMAGGEGLVSGSTQYVTVSGATTTLGPLFVMGSTLTLAFSETGLPTGQSWCAEVDDYQQCSAKTSVDYLNLTPGSYAYAVVSPLIGQEITAKVGKSVIPLSGTLTVTKSWTVGLTFAYPYPVTFTEVGLVSGTHWCVKVGKSTECSYGTSIVFDLENGTYRYAVTVGSGYSLTPMSGMVVVAGPTLPVDLVAYTVTFTETGLPSGTHWCVKLGKTTECSTGPSIVFAEGNGTYTYKVTVGSGYSVTPMSGTVVVNGAAVPANLIAYTVTFTETGLPGGTSWCVKLGKTTECSTGVSIIFAEGNGTYAYKVTVPAGSSVSPSSGSVVVNGAAVPVPINSYAVTFTEGGLTSGTNWCVKIGSTTRCSTTTTVVFYLGNGTYAYKIGAVAGYTVTVSPAKAQVAGGSASMTVTFTPKSGHASGVGAVPLLLGVPLFAPAIKRRRRRASSRLASGESLTGRMVTGHKRLPGPGPSSVATESVRGTPAYDSGAVKVRGAPRLETRAQLERRSGSPAVRTVSRPPAKPYSASPSQAVRRTTAFLPVSNGAPRPWKAGQDRRCRQPEGRVPRVPDPLRPRVR